MGDVDDVLAMDIFALDTECAFAAWILWHDDDAVSDFDGTGLGDFDDFPGGFVSEKVAGVAIGICFVFGAHGCGHNLYACPILCCFWCGDVNDFDVSFGRDNDLLHGEILDGRRNLIGKGTRRALPMQKGESPVIALYWAGDVKCWAKSYPTC